MPFRGSLFAMDSRETLVHAIDTALGRPGLGDALAGRLRITAIDFARGDTLVRAGREVSVMFCVQSGWLTALRYLANGSRQLLDFYVANDLVGLEYLGRARASADLVAQAGGTALSIPIGDFKRAVADDPDASAALLSLMSRRINALQTRLTVFSNGNATTKLIHLLHGLYVKQRRNGVADPHVIRTPLTQTDIADALGLTTVTVNRAFGTLEGAGLTGFASGAITIHDPEAMLAMTDGVVDTTPFTDTFG